MSYNIFYCPQATEHGKVTPLLKLEGVFQRTEEKSDFQRESIIAECII